MTRYEALRLMAMPGKRIVRDGHVYVRLDNPAIDRDTNEFKKESTNPTLELIPVIQLM